MPEAATAIVAVAGLGLLLLARGVRRGQRHAWMLAVALLLVSVVGHVVKGLDVEEALIALAVVTFLFAHHDDFKAPGNPSSARRAVGALLVGIALAIAGGTVGVALRHPDLSLAEIARAVSERLVGIQSVDLPPRIDHLMTPAMLSIGIGIAIAFCWLLFRPAVAPRVTFGGRWMQDTNDMFQPIGNPSAQEDVFRRALSKLLIEIFDGPPGSASAPRPGARSASSPTSTAGRSP